MTQQPTNPSKPLPVIIIGSGGHARVVLDTLIAAGRQVLFLTDSNAAAHGSQIYGHTIKGPDDAILQLAPDSVELAIGVGSVGSPTLRKKIYDRFHALGYRFATVVHPSAVISAQASLAPGVQIMAGVVIQPGAKIGTNTILNTRASIDHDCDIAAHCHIAPGVTLSGTVILGQLTHIGTGSTVIQSVAIGSGVVIGAGSVVLKPIPDGCKAWGIPAQPQPAQKP